MLHKPNLRQFFFEINPTKGICKFLQNSSAFIKSEENWNQLKSTKRTSVGNTPQDTFLVRCLKTVHFQVRFYCKYKSSTKNILKKIQKKLSRSFASPRSGILTKIKRTINWTLYPQGLKGAIVRERLRNFYKLRLIFVAGDDDPARIKIPRNRDSRINLDRACNFWRNLHARIGAFQRALLLAPREWKNRY